MCYILPGIGTFILLILLCQMLLDKEFENPWKTCCQWAVALAVVWYGAYQLQSYFDEKSAAERAAEQERYDRCIVETETFQNNKSVFHLVIDKCAAK